MQKKPLQYVIVSAPFLPDTHARFKGVLGASFCRYIDTDEEGITLTELPVGDKTLPTCERCKGQMLLQQKIDEWERR